VQVVRIDAAHGILMSFIDGKMMDCCIVTLHDIHEALNHTTETKH
jgi:hypothetical protein